ncbi:hypothetical protein KP509_11G076100 [Ceratopteris richardii]|uniref:Secreted protein n=1 Tax=Ceratopteris richardii TaxID=49495 RepID=A0A8T2TWB5_CERRI|nr:hypothetical protein KP509_11G076100 [Ceratopteris richardii]
MERIFRLTQLLTMVRLCVCHLLERYFIHNPIISYECIFHFLSLYVKSNEPSACLSLYFKEITSHLCVSLLSLRSNEPCETEGVVYCVAKTKHEQVVL